MTGALPANRVSLPDGRLAWKTSARPLVSPRTRLLAFDTNTMHFGLWKSVPLSDTLHESPLAGPPIPFEISWVEPKFQGVPFWPHGRLRLTR